MDHESAVSAMRAALSAPAIDEVVRMVKANVAITAMRDALGQEHNQRNPTLANMLAGIARRPDVLDRVISAMRDVSTVHLCRDGDRWTGCVCGATTDHDATPAESQAP